MPKPNLWSSIATAKDVDSKLPTAVKSAARTLRVIEFFVEVRRRARANEIADRLGLPQSSASALLNSMVRLGYLDFDYATHTYEPTLRVAMLGALAHRRTVSRRVDAQHDRSLGARDRLRG
jgi:DNA-binding IclR family transcriptional regulator